MRVLLMLGGKRLSTIMSAALNYLRFKMASDDDFHKMKSKIVRELMWTLLYIYCLHLQSEFFVVLYVID